MISEYHSRLEQALRFVESEGYQPVYVALRGSQNYRLSTEHSDFDYVAVVVPRFDDLVKRNWIQTKEYEYAGGHIDVYDIREYFSCIWKMNPSILETLMTPHHIDSTQDKIFNSCYMYITEAIPYKAGSLALAIKGTFMRYLKRYGRGLGSGLGKSMSHMVRLIVYMERLYTYQVFDPDLLIGSKSSHAVAMAYKEMSDEAVLASNPQERVDWFTERITRLCDTILCQNQKYADSSRGEMYHQRINDMVSWLIKEYIKEEVREEDTVNVGICGSAGSLLFISGHKRYMTRRAKVIFHEGSAQIAGDAVKVMDATKSYEVSIKKMKEYILERTKVPKAQLTSKRYNDWEIDSQYCLENGVCDYVVETLDDIL